MEFGTSKIFLFIENNPFYDSSARGNRYASLLKGLAQCGADVSVYVTGGYNTSKERQDFQANKTVHGIPVTYLVPIPNHTLFWKRINRYLLSPLIKRLLAHRLNKILKLQYDYWWLTINYGVLDFYNKHTGSIKNSLIELNEFQSVLVKNENVTHKIQIKYANKVYKNLLKAIKNIDYFACMTEILLQNYKMMAKPAARFLHLPMTVDLSRFAISSKTSKERYIAYAGSLSNDKDGIDILIKSFARIADQYPDVQLYLAGSNHPDIALQKQLLSELGLEHRVKYVGVLNREDIPCFLANADILALARPDSHQAQGGFPTKLGEYLATKNPVCVTSVGEIPDYLKDNISAFMAIPGSVTSFADALHRALGDMKKAEEIGCAGYSVAERNFNMEVQAKRLKLFLDTNKG